MKRIICCILVCLTAFTLASCNNSNTSNEDFLKSLQNSEEDKKEDGKNKGSIGFLSNETQSDISDKSEDAEGADDKSMNSTGNYTDNAIANEVLAFMDYSEEKPFRGSNYGDTYTDVVSKENMHLIYDDGEGSSERQLKYVFSDDITIDIPGYVIYSFGYLDGENKGLLNLMKLSYYPDEKYSTEDNVEAYRALREFFSTKYTKVDEARRKEEYDEYYSVFQIGEDRYLLLFEDHDENSYVGRRHFVIAFYSGQQGNDNIHLTFN